MRIFKPVTLAWWQVAIVKVCLISLGVILGVSYFVFFYIHLTTVVVIFAVAAIYLIGWWLKQGMRSR